MPNTLKLFNEGGGYARLRVTDNSGQLLLEGFDSSNYAQNQKWDIKGQASFVDFSGSSNALSTIDNAGVIISDGDNVNSVQATASSIIDGSGNTMTATAKEVQVAGNSGTTTVQPTSLTVQDPTNGNVYTRVAKGGMTVNSNGTGSSISNEKLEINQEGVGKATFDPQMISFQNALYSSYLRSDSKNISVEFKDSSGANFVSDGIFDVSGAIMDTQLRGSSFSFMEHSNDNILSAAERDDLCTTLGLDASGYSAGPLPLKMESVTVSSLIGLIAALQDRVKNLQQSVTTLQQNVATLQSTVYEHHSPPPD